MVRLVLLPITLLLKASHNGVWMPASYPAREGNKKAWGVAENTGRVAGVKLGVSEKNQSKLWQWCCDYAYLRPTQGNLRKKKPWDIVHPRAPSAPSYAFSSPLPPLPILSDPSRRWLSHATRAPFHTLVPYSLWPWWHSLSPPSFLVLMFSYPNSLELLQELPPSQLWGRNNAQMHLNLHNALSMSAWRLASV